MKKILEMSLAALIVCAALAASARCSNPDPTQPGPLQVASAIYDFGDTALHTNGFPGPIEFRGIVFYPKDLSNGPYPFLVFLHGRHNTCYDNHGNDSFAWPCSAGFQPIPNFEGYNYIAQNLASNGYIVVSISANGISAADNVPDGGALARAELIQIHLDLWNVYNTSGGAPFGNLFVGKVDLSRVGTMGHSRGGEGVVRHYALNQSLGSPYKIKAVFALAPIDFNHEVINNVPLAVILPYCDGDVSTLEGVHYYDDSRYNVPNDPAPKYVVLVMGANHNYFNTIWTPSIFPVASGDDWGSQDSFCGASVPGNGRLTPAQQENAGLAFVGAFLRANVGGETQFVPLLTGAAPAPPSASPSKIHVSYQAPSTPGLRLDANRFLSPFNLEVNSLGGLVTEANMTPFNVCGASGETTPCLSGQPEGRQPHTDSFFGTGQLSSLITGWGPESGYSFTIPSGLGNVKDYQALQFRAAVNFADPRNATGVPQDLMVVLTDGTGKSGSVRVSVASPGTLFFPPGTASLNGPVPRNILNMVRIPMSEFAAFGVNLSDIARINFRFNETAAGGILVTDVSFTNPPTQ
ncbi:MAG TPA: hypothetical protein VI756_27655 [Blastocatellia bacterium]